MNSSGPLLIDDSTSPWPMLSLDQLIPSLKSTPIYYAKSEDLLPFISDLNLSIVAPIAAYWFYSIFFTLVDWTGWLDSYKIHEPAEIVKRNKVTPAQVIKAVIFQHSIQALMAMVVLEAETSHVDHAQHMASYARWLVAALRLALPDRLVVSFCKAYGSTIVYYAYWWAVPVAQFLFASFVIDTWQYFLHRAMHLNKYLYRTVHSLHHRLYCPYSFGALYNHPLEGFLLDTCGAALAHFLARLNTRQDILCFAIASLKTVDDHCGFNLPWDPFQFLFGNNADYHDIHHQQFGIKKNFSQPFFTHWDVILGTRMTRSESPRAKHTDGRDPSSDQVELKKDL